MGHSIILSFLFFECATHAYNEVASQLDILVKELRGETLPEDEEPIHDKRWFHEPQHNDPAFSPYSYHRTVDAQPNEQSRYGEDVYDDEGPDKFSDEQLEELPMDGHDTFDFSKMLHRATHNYNAAFGNDYLSRIRKTHFPEQENLLYQHTHHHHRKNKIHKGTLSYNNDLQERSSSNITDPQLDMYQKDNFQNNFDIQEHYYPMIQDNEYEPDDDLYEEDYYPFLNEHQLRFQQNNNTSYYSSDKENKNNFNHPKKEGGFLTDYLNIISPNTKDQNNYHKKINDDKQKSKDNYHHEKIDDDKQKSKDTSNTIMNDHNSNNEIFITEKRDIAHEHDNKITLFATSINTDTTTGNNMERSHMEKREEEINKNILAGRDVEKNTFEENHLNQRGEEINKGILTGQDTEIQKDTFKEKQLNHHSKFFLEDGYPDRERKESLKNHSPKRSEKLQRLFHSKGYKSPNNEGNVDKNNGEALHSLPHHNIDLMVHDPLSQYDSGTSNQNGKEELNMLPQHKIDDPSHSLDRYKFHNLHNNQQYEREREPDNQQNNPARDVSYQQRTSVQMIQNNDSSSDIHSSHTTTSEAHHSPVQVSKTRPRLQKLSKLVEHAHTIHKNNIDDNVLELMNHSDHSDNNNNSDPHNMSESTNRLLQQRFQNDIIHGAPQQPIQYPFPAPNHISRTNNASIHNRDENLFQFSSSNQTNNAFIQHDDTVVPQRIVPIHKEGENDHTKSALQVQDATTQNVVYPHQKEDRHVTSVQGEKIKGDSTTENDIFDNDKLTDQMQDSDEAAHGVKKSMVSIMQESDVIPQTGSVDFLQKNNTFLPNFHDLLRDTAESSGSLHDLPMFVPPYRNPDGPQQYSNNVPHLLLHSYSNNPLEKIPKQPHQYHRPTIANMTHAAFHNRPGIFPPSSFRNISHDYNPDRIERNESFAHFQQVFRPIQRNRNVVSRSPTVHAPVSVRSFYPMSHSTFTEEKKSNHFIPSIDHKNTDSSLKVKKHPRTIMSLEQFLHQINPHDADDTNHETLTDEHPSDLGDKRNDEMQSHPDKNGVVPLIQVENEHIQNENLHNEGDGNDLSKNMTHENHAVFDEKRNTLNTITDQKSSTMIDANQVTNKKHGVSDRVMIPNNDKIIVDSLSDKKNDVPDSIMIPNNDKVISDSLIASDPRLIQNNNKNIDDVISAMDELKDTVRNDQNLGHELNDLLHEQIKTNSQRQEDVSHILEKKSQVLQDKIRYYNKVSNELTNFGLEMDDNTKTDKKDTKDVKVNKNDEKILGMDANTKTDKKDQKDVKVNKNDKKIVQSEETHKKEVIDHNDTTDVQLNDKKILQSEKDIHSNPIDDGFENFKNNLMNNLGKNIFDADDTLKKNNAIIGFGKTIFDSGDETTKKINAISDLEKNIFDSSITITKKNVGVNESTVNNGDETLKKNDTLHDDKINKDDKTTKENNGVNDNTVINGNKSTQKNNVINNLQERPDQVIDNTFNTLKKDDVQENINKNISNTNNKNDVLHGVKDNHNTINHTVSLENESIQKNISFQKKNPNIVDDVLRKELSYDLFNDQTDINTKKLNTPNELPPKKLEAPIEIPMKKLEKKNQLHTEKVKAPNELNTKKLEIPKQLSTNKLEKIIPKSATRMEKIKKMKQNKKIPKNDISNNNEFFHIISKIKSHPTNQKKQDHILDNEIIYGTSHTIPKKIQDHKIIKNSVNDKNAQESKRGDVSDMIPNIVDERRSINKNRKLPQFRIPDDNRDNQKKYKKNTLTNSNDNTMPKDELTIQSTLHDSESHSGTFDSGHVPERTVQRILHDSESHHSGIFDNGPVPDHDSESHHSGIFYSGHVPVSNSHDSGTLDSVRPLHNTIKSKEMNTVSRSLHNSNIDEQISSELSSPVDKFSNHKIPLVKRSTKMKILERRDRALSKNHESVKKDSIDTLDLKVNPTETPIARQAHTFSKSSATTQKNSSDTNIKTIREQILTSNHTPHDDPINHDLARHIENKTRFIKTPPPPRTQKSLLKNKYDETRNRNLTKNSPVQNVDKDSNMDKNPHSSAHNDEKMILDDYLNKNTDMGTDMDLQLFIKNYPNLIPTSLKKLLGPGTHLMENREEERVCGEPDIVIRDNIPVAAQPSAAPNSAPTTNESTVEISSNLPEGTAAPIVGAGDTSQSTNQGETIVEQSPEIISAAGFLKTSLETLINHRDPQIYLALNETITVKETEHNIKKKPDLNGNCECPADHVCLIIEFTKWFQQMELETGSMNIKDKLREVELTMNTNIGCPASSPLNANREMISKKMYRWNVKNMACLKSNGLEEEQVNVYVGVDGNVHAKPIQFPDYEPPINISSSLRLWIIMLMMA